MTNEYGIIVTSCHFHRNGIGGTSFKLVRFKRGVSEEYKGETLDAVVTDDDCFVFCRRSRGHGYRGDFLFPELKAAIEVYESRK